MATAKNDGILPVPFFADENLASYQYYCAATASTAGYVILATGACEPVPIGVIQDNNASNIGEAVSVKMFGITKANVAACDLADNACPIRPGLRLTTNPSGRLCRAGSDEMAVAMSLGSISTACRVADIEVFFFGGMFAASGQSAS